MIEVVDSVGVPPEQFGALLRERSARAFEHLGTRGVIVPDPYRYGGVFYFAQTPWKGYAGYTIKPRPAAGRLL